MAYVPIPKDLKRVKTKVAFNLTKRQLIGFSIAGLLGFSAYIFVRKLVPNDIAVLTLFEKDGLVFEQYFKLIYLHRFYQPGKRVRKEVYLAEQKKIANNHFKEKQKGIKKKATGERP